MADQPAPSSEQLADQVFELKKTLDQFTRLVEISLTLNSTLDQDVILNSILETASELIACEEVSILLYDEDHDVLNFVASTDAASEKLYNIPVPIDESIAGTIFLTKKPQIINTLSNNPFHYSYVSEKLNIQNTSLVGVPMRIRDKVIGVIEGINKREGSFTRQDADILTVIASQAAVAINNARMLESLQAAYEELSQIDKIKTEFISIASHELRTPLFHILGYAALLEQESQGDSSENLQQVLKSAKLLQDLVEDMTNMNLLEARSREMDTRKVELKRVLEDAYQEVKASFKERRIETRWKAHKTALQVSADPSKLKQAFVNIFKNAARFTPEGGQVEIHLKQEKHHAKISISDNGIGITPDKLESIFDRMRQSGDPTTRSYGGLGLGLPMARGLIQLHNGKIWAESAGKNKGTTIVCTLPLAAVPPFIVDQD
ncbi:MAG: GAF domain-containing sensor histidine kinase [Anaerolineales bacterium]|jgi:signal transduction histidine kinase